MRTTSPLAAGAAALMLALTSASSAYAQSPSPRSPAITIYHIEGTRGERIVWLCEELELPYTLEFTPGNPAASMQRIRTVNPTMPMSPTVRYDDQLLVESGAIMELLLAREGNGRLMPARDSGEFAYYLQWMHFAEGSLAARIVADYRVAQARGSQERPAARGVSGSDTLQFADSFLAKHAYFGGEEFSAADIMMLFPIVYAAERLKVITLSDYPNIVKWRERVEARPAFQRMVKAARPKAG